jgi:hypothetical protein
MSLTEFKSIFFYEWAHRMWGRAIGVFFLVPAGYFLARGYLVGKTKWRALEIGSLIGFQVRIESYPLPVNQANPVLAFRDSWDGTWSNLVWTSNTLKTDPSRPRVSASTDLLPTSGLPSLFTLLRLWKG